MLDETMLPQEIYWQHLKTVGDIKFTSREMEVISCILNVRKTYGIASLLSIDPKTVDAHIRNITQKLRCSRDSIIDFIEKSEKVGIIKNQYYQLIKIRSHFEQCLKKTLLPPLSEKPTCEIINWLDSKEFLSSPLQKHLKNQLIEHLKPYLILNQTTKNLENFSLYGEESKHLAFHLVPKTILEQFQTNKVQLKAYQLTQFDPDSAIFLLADKIPSTALFEEEAESTQMGYYFTTFEILKVLLPDINFDKNIADFKEEYELTNNGSKERVSPLPLDKPLTDFKKPFEVSNNDFGESKSRDVFYCSFCGKSPHEVHQLIASHTTSNTLICNECLEECEEIKKQNTLYCSFCGKSQHEVRNLIAGPTILTGPSILICDKCSELGMDTLRN